MRAGGQLSAGATPAPPLATTMAKMYTSQTNATTSNGISQGVAAVGQMAGSIISYSAQMNALESQSRMQEAAWEASIAAIKSESGLLDDVKAIHAHKTTNLGVKLARTQKDKAIAEARLFEAKKTQKSMKSANKAVLKKALSDRRQRFYGKAQ